MAKSFQIYYEGTGQVWANEFAPIANSGGNHDSSTTEAHAQAIWAVGGTLSDIWGNIFTGGAGDAVTVRKNGASQSLALAITGTGEFEDTTGPVTVAANDKLAYECDGSISFHALRTVFDATTNTATSTAFVTATNTNFGVNNQIRHRALIFLNSTGSTGNNLFLRMGQAGVIKRHYINMTVNGETAVAVTLEPAINNVASGNQISIPTSTTGLFEYTGADTVYAQDDDITWLLDRTGGTSSNNSVRFRIIGGTFVTTNDKFDTLALSRLARTTTGTNFWPIGGPHDEAANTNEAPAEIKIPFDCVASRLRIRSRINTADNATTVTLRKNGVDTALAVTITAEATTIFEDNVNTVSFLAGDKVSYKVTGDPATGSNDDVYCGLTFEEGTGSVAQDLLANDLSVTPALSTPAVGQAHALLANDLAVTATLGQPGIGQGHNLLADDLSVTPTLTAAVLGQDHVLLANDLAVTATLSQPTLEIVSPLLAENLAVTATLSQPSLGQVHVFTSTDVAVTPALSQPALGQDHDLLADDLAVTPTLTQPALGVEHALSGDDISVVPQLGQPTLSEIVDLLANDISVTPTLSLPTLAAFNITLEAQRTLTLPAETRLTTLKAETRLFTPPAEPRTATLKAEPRIKTLPKESRILNS